MVLTNDFISKYFGSTKPEFILLYIFLTKSEQRVFSLDEVCEYLNITSATAKKGLKFWQEHENFDYDLKEDILTINTHILLEDATIREVSNEDLLKIKDDPDFLSIVQLIRSKMRIAMQDLPRLAYYYLKCGFTKEMFVTMLVYSSEHNADNVAYLFRICEKWIELGIDSIEKAIDWKNGDYAVYIRIMRCIGITRYPVKEERHLLSKVLKDQTEQQLVDKLNNLILQYPDKPATWFLNEILEK